jgi:hypothetical protein
MRWRKKIGFFSIKTRHVTFFDIIISCVKNFIVHPCNSENFHVSLRANFHILLREYYGNISFLFNLSYRRVFCLR